ncbi:hypothetical protein [Runella sp.]|uniref:hypothetical protein n=1 Tax=Runella sp. TaxID=1960881 RepID=UPI003018719F
MVENPDNPKILKILILTMYTRGNCLNHDFRDDGIFGCAIVHLPRFNPANLKILRILILILTK